MTWPALTPLEFSAVSTVTAVLLIAISGGLLWLILRILPRKWREAEAIDQAVAMVCKPCSWTDPTARCTCPDKGCTATTCPKRERKGPQ